MIYENQYDIEADVVVVGYGAAGSTAAITAHDDGADVIILEKMSEGGGNSKVFAGNVIIPEGMEFADYLDIITAGTTEREIIDTFVERQMKIEDWVKQMGGELESYHPLMVTYPYPGHAVNYPTIPGANTVRHKHTFKGPQRAPDEKNTAAKRWWDFFSSNVERRGIKVMLNTPAKELIKNNEGEIVGVIAESEGKDFSIKARKAVIMTCGGFENDEDMKMNYLPIKLRGAFKFWGTPANTGDGIRMTQKIGAALWHMSTVACRFAFYTPEYEGTFPIVFLSPRYIFVDKYGRRFVDEIGFDAYEYTEPCSFLDTENFEYPRVPFYAIFGEEVKRRGALCWGSYGYTMDKYEWSLDNSTEIKKGWITKAKTIAKLAKRISMAESTLEDTIAKYSVSCQEGRDDDFGRAKEYLKEIDGPSYYAIQLWPSLINTQGGPRRDKEARVLDPDGKPIPGLYAAGELGSILGFKYNTACNMSECIVFGQIAGHNAASDMPVDS